MSIFSSKKKIKVDSSTYDLVGLDKPNYMKLSVLKYSISSERDSDKESLSSYIINGPANLQKTAVSWATKHYQEGFPTLILNLNVANDPTFKNIINNYLQQNNYKNYTIQSIIKKPEDLTSLTNSWLNKYYPLSDYSYNPDYETDEDDNQYIKISLSEKYANILIKINENNEQIEKYNKDLENPELTQDEINNINKNISTLEDDNNLLEESLPPKNITPNEQDDIDEKDIDETTYIYLILNNNTDLHFNPEKEIIDIIIKYTEDYTQEIIYIIGSGYSDIDNYKFVNNSYNNFSFYPIIPLRINKAWINNGNNTKNKYKKLDEKDKIHKTERVNIKSNNPELFDKTNKYFKKLNGNNKDTNLNTLEAQLEDTNKNIDKINYTFIHTGISINTDRKYGARYLFEFFNSFVNIQNYQIILQTNVYKDIFQWKIAWNNIIKSTINLKDFFNKEQQDWILKEKYTTNLIINRKFNKILNNDLNTGLVIYRLNQDKKTLLKLIIYNPSYSNHVYKNKWSTKTWKNVLEHQLTTPEDPSDIIIPYQKDILKTIPITYKNELCNENQFIVFNSYKVYKQKWYQRGFFKIFIMIIAVSVVVFLGASGIAPFLSSTAGLLSGGAIASTISIFVGGGVIGAIAGAIGNILVATIVTSIISKVIPANGVFKIILQSLIATFTMSFLNTLNMAQTLNSFLIKDITQLYSKLLDPKFLNSLTNVIQKSSQEIIKEKVKDLNKKQEKFTKENKQELWELEKKKQAMLGDRHMQFVLQQDFIEKNNPKNFYKKSLLNIQDLIQFNLNAPKMLSNPDLLTPALTQIA